MLEESCCGGDHSHEDEATVWPCANDVRKAVDMALTYIGEKEETGRQRFLERVKRDIEHEANLDCYDGACEHSESKCTFDYEIGDIRTTVLVKPGGKTELHGKTVSDGCWRFEATVLCGCWCLATV